MDRRSFSTAVIVGAASSVLVGAARAQNATAARNVVLVHGAYADGSCWSEVIGRLAWRSRPSRYAISTGDRTIAPELQRYMAGRMNAKTIEVKASHLSLISHPDAITNLILQAAMYRK
jgi:pimeloyl-ACP methyl ester carboxylesterase